MKKTDKTALTAAIFAAAMSAASLSGSPATAADIGTGSDGLQSQLGAFAPVYGPAPDLDDTDPTETEPATTSIEDLEQLQDVYGPPVSMVLPTVPEETVSSSTTAAEPDPTSEPASIEPTTEPVYGPMWDPGDANLDGNVDVFDLPLIRKHAVNENTGYMTVSRLASDVNNDGNVNVADLVAMSQYLMGQRDRLGSGKIKKNKIKVIYDEAVQPATEEETSPIEDIPQPKYGPPYSYDPDEPFDPLDPIEEPTYQAYYGPPSFFGLEDF